MLRYSLILHVYPLHCKLWTMEVNDVSLTLPALPTQCLSISVPFAHSVSPYLRLSNK